MLTRRLRLLKNQLESKGAAKRTTGESELLAELAFLDGSAELKKALLTEGIEDRAFAGAAGTCGCCGHPL